MTVGDLERVAVWISHERPVANRGPESSSSKQILIVSCELAEPIDFAWRLQTDAKVRHRQQRLISFAVSMGMMANGLVRSLTLTTIRCRTAAHDGASGRR